MRRSQRINSVIKLADRRQDELRNVFMAAQQAVELGQDKLRQLQGYLAEYRISHAPRQGQRLDIAQLQSARMFMEKLHGAIAIQEKEVQRLQKSSLAARESWLNAERYRQSLVKLQEQYKLDEQIEDNKVDQKRTDEMAGMSFARKMITASTSNTR